MKWKWTWTKVVNLTAIAVLIFCTATHVTYSNATVGAIALMVYSVANLFTEGGVREKKVSRTVIVNGIGAIVGLVTAAHLVVFTDAQSAQIAMLVCAGLNLVTEGGIAIDGAPPGAAAALLAALLAVVAASCTSTLPAAQQRTYDACTDLYRGEARRVCHALDSATDDLYMNDNQGRGVLKLRMLYLRAQFDALVGLLPWTDVHGSDQWPGLVQSIHFMIGQWNERVNDCRHRRDDPGQDAQDFVNRRCDRVLGARRRLVINP